MSIEQARGPHATQLKLRAAVPYSTHRQRRSLPVHVLPTYDIQFRAGTPTKKNWTFLDLYVSTLAREHANLLCICPNLIDAPKGRQTNCGNRTPVDCRVHSKEREGKCLYSLLCSPVDSRHLGCVHYGAALWSPSPGKFTQVGPVTDATHCNRCGALRVSRRCLTAAALSDSMSALDVALLINARERMEQDIDVTQLLFDITLACNNTCFNNVGQNSNKCMQERAMQERTHTEASMLACLLTLCPCWLYCAWLLPSVFKSVRCGACAVSVRFPVRGVAVHLLPAH